MIRIVRSWECAIEAIEAIEAVAVVVVVVVIALAACASETSFERVQIVSENEPDVTNGMSALGSITTEDVDYVALFSRSGKPRGHVREGIVLTLLATINPPSLDGVSLQAADVQIVGDRLYASYNQAGPALSGALQVMDIADPARPTGGSMAVYASLEFGRVVVAGERVYAGGEDATQGATIELFNTDGDSLIQGGFVRLPSFATTYLSLKGDTLYASYGDRDGGITIFDASGELPVERTSFEMEDARWVDGIGDDVLVISGPVGGTSAQLSRHMNVFDAMPGPVISSDIRGAQIGAPTWASRDDSHLFISADEAGLLVRNLDTLSDVGMLETEGTANGSALVPEQGLLMLANGEEGLVVARIDDTAAPLALASFDIDDRGSANAVSVQGDILALADGLGGVKLFRYELFEDCRW